MPPTQSPLRLEAAILCRMRSEVTSRSNWANDNKTFSVSLPMEVVVLNCWGDRYERHPIAIEQLDELGADADIVELVLMTPSGCHQLWG
jgi:hypothetical protein